MKNLVYADNITYKVGKRVIINGISFSAGKGAFVCILGPNGAGKSTIIKLLCGLLTPHSGTVNIMGKDVNAYSKKKLATLVSYVPQFSPNDIRFSVEEYVATGRYPHQSAVRGASATDKKTIEQAMDVTAIHTMRERDVSTLSGGERQRVMIAAALAQEAQILLLDEPTIFLDPKSSMDILELLAKIHASGTTVIMVTHDINQALMFGTSFIGVKDGGILFNETDGPALTESDKLDTLFDTRFCRVENGGITQVLPHRSLK